MASNSRRWSSPVSVSGNTTHFTTVKTTNASSLSVQHHSSMTTLNSAKVFDLSSLYNERAGPRIDSPLILHDLSTHSPTPSTVSPVSTPDYTHVTNLYPSLQPQQPRGGHQDSSLYRYSPATASVSEITTATMSLPQQIHAPSPESHMSATLGPLAVDVRDSPTLSTTSVSSGRTDPEAEVDALTNLLLQGLDTVGRKKRTRSSKLTQSGSSTHPSSAINVNNNYNPDMIMNNNDNVGSISSNSGHSNGGAEEVVIDASSKPRNRSHHAGHDCFRCRRTIPIGEHIHLSALRTHFHMSCFACYACGIPLTGTGNEIHSTAAPGSSGENNSPAAYFHAGDRLLCDRCVMTTVENCHSCGRPIAERLLRALGHAYHPSCFTCRVCLRALDGQPFTVDVHGQIHCLEDFHRQYAPRCHKCGEAIAPGPGENEARRVVTGGYSYHVACFRRR